MKAAFVALCLASVALAQIPTGISAGCSTFLTQLNTNQVVNNCLTSLISETSVFDPTTPNASTTNANQTAVYAALSNICSSSFTACPAAEIRSSLTSFLTACQGDISGTNGDGSNGNKEVLGIYDVMYIILPLKEAICSKANGKYCINRNAATTPAASSSNAAATSGGVAPSDNAAPSGSASSSDNASSSSSPSASASSSSSASASSASASAPAKRHAPLAPSQLFKRTAHGSNLIARQATNTNGTNQETLSGISPNSDEYRNTGLPYLFIQPNSTNICGDTCTAEIIGAYIRFETVTPYAIGIAKSPMLGGQVKLWETIKQCPDGFAQSLLDNNTGTTAGSTGSAAKAVAGVGSALVAVFAAVGATFLL